jgi:hypothetical protein
MFEKLKNLLFNICCSPHTILNSHMENLQKGLLFKVNLSKELICQRSLGGAQIENVHTPFDFILGLK